jgi:hydrogenase/urease accessory protein HupE
MNRARPILIATILMLASSVLTSGALAHWADLAVAEITPSDQEVRVTLTYPTGLTAFADDDKNGSLSPAEITRHKDALRNTFADKIHVTSGTQTGSLEIAPVMGNTKLPSSVNAQAHTTLGLKYDFAQPIHGFSVRYDLFVPNVSTASALVTVLNDGKVQNVVFTPENRTFKLEKNAAPVDFKSFIFLGLEHILTGYDHLLFLLSLLALGGGFRYLLKVVTAFTVAHSVTLALTVLGVITLPGRFIESGIALSIAYVALENILRRDSKAVEKSRWIVTFVFGLLHGMGFADLLREMNLPAANIPGALIGFNLGVEIGQLSVVIPLFLLLRLLERWRVGAPVRWAASAFAVAAGLFWFVQRAFLTA